ncbi:MAG: hypothetical protein ACOYW3_04980 [Bacteroidota bacterium]
MSSEGLNDFVKGIKERLSSPFFFSFVLAWIFFNWRITIALLWYNSDLYATKDSLIEFIETNTSNTQSIFLPLLSAILYTGLFRNLVSALVAFTTKWGEDWNLNILKDSKVPMNKFLTYRSLYTRTSKELEKVIEDERKTIEEFDKQRQRLNELDAANNSANREITTLKDLNTHLSAALATVERNLVELRDENEALKRNSEDQRLIEGYWKFRYDNAFQNLHFDEKLQIRDGVISRVDGNTTEGVYEIVSYFFDGQSKKVVMVFRYLQQTALSTFLTSQLRSTPVSPVISEIERRSYLRTVHPQVLVHTLTLKNDSFLTGLENLTAVVSYERLS